MSMMNLSADQICESQNTRRTFAGDLSLQQALKLVRAWIVVAKERRELRQMDQRTAQDAGVSLDDARREANKPFWDLGPATRCRFGL